jgi:type I restriction enzyme S subunit
MAEEIYKEWFVRLRFPGHEQTPIVDGLPEGWEIIKIEEAFDILGGGTPSTAEKKYWEDGNINWVTPSDITAAAGMFIHATPSKITKSGLEASSAKLFPPYSVMMTSRATIGEIGINLQPAATNQGFITCLPNDYFPFTYIAEWLIYQKAMIDSYASGATFKEISKSVFKKVEIVRPSLQVIEKYHQNVEPLFHAMSNYLEKNKLLKQTRDLLLPRLMSGRLSVDHLPEP